MKTIRYLSALIVSLALPYLIVGAFGGGPNAARTLQAGLLMLAVGTVTAAWMYLRRRRIRDEGDERDDFLLFRAMAFAFYVMIVAVTTVFMWPFTTLEAAQDAMFWLVAVLWGSFMVGYVYNRVRH